MILLVATKRLATFLGQWRRERYLGQGYYFAPFLERGALKIGREKYGRLPWMLQELQRLQQDRGSNLLRRRGSTIFTLFLLTVKPVLGWIQLWRLPWLLHYQGRQGLPGENWARTNQILTVVYSTGSLSDVCGLWVILLLLKQCRVLYEESSHQQKAKCWGILTSIMLSS